MTGFVILALPRSRTAWLARFLSYRDWHCGHEQLRYVRSLDDVRAWLSQPNTGTCETAAAPFWRLLLKYSPDTRIITVRRPVGEVVDSLLKAGISVDRATLQAGMARYDRKLDQIERRVPGVMSVTFADLAAEETCRRIFETCLPYPHDHQRWVALAGENIQISLSAMVRYVKENYTELDRVATIAMCAMLKDLRSRKAASGEVTVREETVDDLARDGREMMERHCLKIGEKPDAWMTRNIPLLRALQQQGFFQVIIGRCNGKVFGYLGTAISPSLENQSWTVAENGMFYAAEEVPGLGLKMQRAAIRALRSKGVRQLFMRSGLRGDGQRMDVLYRRLGAQDFGKLYCLNLED